MARGAGVVQPEAVRGGRGLSAKMLIAGLIPGVMTAFIFLFGIYIWARLKPDHAALPKHEVSFSES